MVGSFKQPHWRGFVTNTGAIAPAGISSKDIPAQTIGFIPIKLTGGDPKTVTSLNAQTHPLFKIVYGKAPFAAQKAKATFSDKKPFETPLISKNSITNWEGFKAKKLKGGSTGEVWTVGYDGINADKTLKAPKDWSEAIVSVQMWGTPVAKATGTYSQEVSIFIDKGCIEKQYVPLDQIGDEITYANASANALADDFMKKWNEYKFLGTSIPVSRLVKASKLRLTNPAQTAKTVACRKYAVTVVCDEGDGTALGRVQAQYPGYKVILESRNNATKESTYTMWRTVAQSTPATLSITNATVTDCAGTCPTGYTKVNAANLFEVRVPAGVTVPVINDGGGTPVSVEISRTKVAANTMEDVYHIVVPTTTTLTIVNTQLSAVVNAQISLVGVRSSICNLTTAQTYSWVQVDSAYRATKDYSLTLMLKDCKGTFASRLAEVQAKYPYLTITEEEIGTCMAVYKTSVLSECTTEECKEEAIFTIEAPAPFERGMNWEEFTDVVTTPDCTTPTAPAAVCEAVGLRFEAASFNRYTDECSYGYFMWDASDVDPVMIKVTVQKHDHTLSLCDSKFEFPVTKVREIEYEKGYGAAVREIENRWFNFYEYFTAFKVDPVDRALYGLTAIAKPEFYYDEYRLTFNEHQGGSHPFGNTYVTDSIGLRMFFKEGTGKAFENVINGYVAGISDKSFAPVVL